MSTGNTANHPLTVRAWTHGQKNYQINLLKWVWYLLLVLCAKNVSFTTQLETHQDNWKSYCVKSNGSQSWSCPKLVTGLEVQQMFSFPSSLLRHYEMPECFYVSNCCFWAHATALSGGIFVIVCVQKPSHNFLQIFRPLRMFKIVLRDSSRYPKQLTLLCLLWLFSESAKRIGYMSNFCISQIWLLLFGPFTMFLEICMQIHSVVFALRRQINKQTYAKIVNLICAGNTVFVKYQAQGGLTPNPPCARPCWI